MHPRTFLQLGLLLASSLTMAQSNPTGLWKTFDDDTGKPSSLVRIISTAGGTLEGRIEKLLDPDEPANPLCEQCTDSRRNQPLLGMLILRNARLNDKQAGQWEGGELLDPENGKVYRAVLTLNQEGRRLDVRGYLGTPLFGRTQKWLRAD